jgi:hypothetical protein
MNKQTKTPGINWIDRNKKPPENGEYVLVWGTVPTLHGTSKSMFLGEAQYRYNQFTVDYTGHFGLVMVTHWAELNPPSEVTASPSMDDQNGEFSKVLKKAWGHTNDE